MATQYKAPMSLDNFLKVSQAPDGKSILDPYTFYMTELPAALKASTGQTLRIDRSTAGVPDLISWNQYSTHDYWWMLCLVNLMIRPESQIVPGEIFFLPSLPDVDAFITSATRQARTPKIVRLGVANAPAASGSV